VLILRLPVSTVTVKVLLSPFLNVIMLMEAEAVIRAFGVYDAVAAYDALVEPEAYDALAIELNPYGPNTLDELTHDAVAANVLLDAYDALVAKNELEAYEALTTELGPYGPYILEAVINDAVPTVNELVGE
jgi:hypothetical protein